MSFAAGFGRLVAAFAFLWFATLPGAAADGTGRKVALVIGNGAYKAVPTLANPPNDSAGMAAALKRIGFEVTQADNLDNGAMRRALRDFEEAVTGADIALIYYAGHGMEVDGTNYLIPVDASLRRDTFVEDEAVPLQRVLAAVNGASKLRIVILDACRDNPFAAKMARSAGKRSVGRGLARIEPGGATLVAYAAKEGTTADDGASGNSPFAKALLGNLETPGLEVTFLFRRVRDQVMQATGGRQEPFVYGSLGSDPIYFVPVKVEQAAAGPVTQANNAGPGPSQGVTSDAMAAAYDRAERLNTVEGWDAFLSNCQSGMYCSLAAAAKQKMVAARTIPSTGSGSPTATTSIPAGRGIAECDRLAAGPNDADKPASVRGVEFSALQTTATQAIAACRQAMTEDPSARRLIFQLARALHAGGRTEEARGLYQRAADAGSAGAVNNLGQLAEQAKDYNEAFRLYRQAADLGSAEGLHNVGYSYEMGQGAQQNASEARRFYDRAVQLGNARSMNRLAKLYLDGNGGTQDTLTAISLYTRAAEAGNAEAARTLGGLYQAGRYTRQDYAEALRWYRRAADGGDGSAMASVGYFYDVGNGVAVDYAEARRWYERGMAAGDTDAMNNLALLLDSGRGGPQDSPRAFQLFQQAAARGHVSAMASIGYMYDLGRGTTRDYVEARKWYTQAADKGNAIAAYNVGLLYDNGRGVAQSREEAFRWYMRGANGGDRDSMNNVGYAYFKGQGVQQNFGEARRWYEQAAEKGHAGAMYNIGAMYANGNGVAKDTGEARRWYEKAANAGDAEAMFTIGYNYENGINGVSRDLATAISWYNRAASANSAGAMTNLGKMYQQGSGVARDYNAALNLFRKSAALGNATAKAHIGYHYDLGLGVTKDYVEARKWYTDAATGGDVTAAYNLAILYAEGRGGERDYVQARRYYEQASDLGDPTSPYGLAVLYQEGRGVPVNVGRATNYYVLALSRRDKWTASQFRDAPGSFPAESRRAVQQFLIDKGYLSGPADGEIGPATKSALDRWISTG